MAIKRVGENALTYILQRIKNVAAGKVDKVDGKGLSANDYTTAEKNKLAGLSNYSLPTASSSTKGGVKIGAGLMMDGDTLNATGGGTADSVAWGNVTGKPDFKTVATSGSYNDLTNKPTIPTVPTISTNVDTDASSDTKTVSPKAVKTYVDTKTASVYKPQGSTAFASLPTLSSSIEGYVYNVTDAFTTTSGFVEGSGHAHPAGSNVVCIKISGSYKWDVLAGTVDLSAYTPTADNIELTNSEVDAIWNTVFGA